MFAAASLLAFTLAVLPSANAFFRVACSGDVLLRERADPIVNPGTKSGHMHTIHGGNAFALNYTYEQARQSSCTSCQVTTDLSNYWHPQLWFHDKKADTFEPVPNGGLLIYYQQRGDDKANIKAFPAGFRMLTGNPAKRSKHYEEDEGSQAELQERATKWSCLRYTGGQTGYDGYGFPTTRCEAGFQARLHMPNCWDGKNLDSADHKSHVAYMSRLDNGKCPDTHPVSLMTMFFEVTWDIKNFDSQWDPETDGWPFVYSYGDPTGYGWHGDFVNGWDVNALQSAVVDCDNNTEDTAAGRAEGCPHLTLQTADAAKQCQGTPHIDEPTTGVLKRLPGCNPLQYGPEDAKMYSDANCPLDGGAASPEPSSPAPEEPTTTPPVPSSSSSESEPTSTPEPIPEPTTMIPDPEPTESSTDSSSAPTATSAPVATVTVIQTVTQTVTATVSPCTASSFASSPRKHHRRSVVPDNFVQGRAPAAFQPRRR
ncbi:hypothetical protein BKA62DRAFT_683507 [Auriculariales sp. MPI-PUGE-AT-0066]|nr:hypothetical protein BKA62DRAFT_683507 [Auriculariales sp. MPI-PUGE-AT-0066]